ncbi:MAG: helix-turn-helix domain-containing protein [Nitriliruptorales bacterium]|nr:helix-turn-helix domain-containing protein [Nitriliruptorales bacterium]
MSRTRQECGLALLNQSVESGRCEGLTRTRHVVQDGSMSQPEMEQPAIPEWTLGWRLQRALAWGNVSVQEMADELDVSRGTISRWCNDHGVPRSIYLRAWAARCRVPYEWLINEDEESQIRRFVQADARSGDAEVGPSTHELTTQFRKRLSHKVVTHPQVVSKA